MAKKFLTPIDMGKQEIQNVALQNLASAPSSPVEGQTYYNTTDHTAYIYANGAWLDLGVQGGAGSTNITISRTSTDVTVASDTGTDDSIAAADASNAGVMTAAMYSKLNSVEANADVTDATNVGAAGAFMKSTDDLDDITDGTTYKKYSATEKTKLAGIEAAADVTDAGNVGSAIHGATAKTTPVSADELPLIDSAASNVLKRITYGNLSSAIVALITDSAPGTLDTLNEIAAALGDDPNFATTITASIATKLAQSANLSDVANAATAFGNIKQAATTGATGVVELATQTETETKTDTARAVTPSGLANFTQKKTFTIGDGTSTSITVTHGLGTNDVLVQVRQASDDAVVECDITQTSTTQTTLGFGTAPASNALKVVIIG